MRDMIQLTSKTSEASEQIPEPEAPTKQEIQKRMACLEQRGVPTELPCAECDTAVEVSVLPEERDVENQKTICRSCAEAHFQDVGLL